MITLEQQYARDIYPLVKGYARAHTEDSKERKEYGSMAHRLPILVQTAGLVQALAFVDAKGKNPHKELLSHLALVVNGSGDINALLSLSRDAEFREYRYLTQRVNLALSWFKRFAQSVLKVDPGTEED